MLELFWKSIATVSVSTLSALACFQDPDFSLILEIKEKSETCLLLFVQRFGEIRNYWENHSFVYTNGSKTEDRVAAAASLVAACCIATSPFSFMQSLLLKLRQFHWL